MRPTSTMDRAPRRPPIEGLSSGPSLSCPPPSSSVLKRLILFIMPSYHEGGWRHRCLSANLGEAQQRISPRQCLSPCESCTIFSPGWPPGLTHLLIKQEFP